MVPLTAPLFGGILLRGHISVKNRTDCPLLRESATPFQSTCLLGGFRVDLRTYSTKCNEMDRR
jgi:hypothetical protein